jgi:hypothetical protein
MLGEQPNAAYPSARQHDQREGGDDVDRRGDGARGDGQLGMDQQDRDRFGDQEGGDAVKGALSVHG